MEIYAQYLHIIIYISLHNEWGELKIQFDIKAFTCK